ncbi:MAG TPA: LuxR C-terminal-related transcriptional regulator [Caldimonas sp.]
MSSLRKADLHAGLRFVGALAEAAGDAQGFARAGVDALPMLVASDITTLSVCDLVSGRRSVVASPGSSLSTADRACFDRYFHEHPLVRYHADLGGRGAHRISDSIPFVRFRHTALYSEYYRRIGIDHAVALPVRVDDRRLVSFVLNRRGRDFSDRECELLDLVGAHLAPLYRKSAAPAASLDALPLTQREREVLRWVGAGKTDRDIAAIVGCSHRTVHKHLERVYAKLGVETRTAAVMRALDVSFQ